jgi:HD-GYP domain-containing protein (c-di-GMP phosphodiesterase class II)
MSQTILIEDNEDFKKLYSLNLTTYAGTDVVDRADANDAIALLKILPSINLIITKPKIGSEYTAIDLWKYIEKYQLDIPMIILGECKELSDKVLTLKSPIDWEILIQHAKKLLGVSDEDVQKKIVPDYVPVESKYFYEINHSPCDIFIRIKKSNAEFDYVKRIHAQDSFEVQDIKKYEDQGLKEFYVEKDYQQYFVNFVTTKLIQKLESQDLGIEDRLNINSAAYDMVKDHIQTAGIDENIAELANSSINSMIFAIKENPKLGDLLKMLLSTRISYAYQHAHLVCVIGNFIMSKQKWYEEKHLDIFSMSAFFSDITLKSVTQMRVNTEHDLDNSGLSEIEKNEVVNHAIDAATLISGTEFYSEYLFLVIKQHQGSIDGTGFPTEPSEEIHPIAKCFLIADAFVKIMLDPKGPKNKKDILSILYAQYTNASYQKIIKVLENKIE